MASDHAEQLDLIAWADEEESERVRVERINAARAGQRAYVVLATDPKIDATLDDYRLVYLTEAATPAKAVAKVRPLAEGRRLRAYLASGQYRELVPRARWVA